MVSMMEVVVEDGTAKRAQVPGYRVAGKTGTAKAAAGGYSDTDRIGSFVGLIPADNPRLAIAISVDTPTEGYAYGGVVAAPAFAEIAAESMRILGIAPTENIPEKNTDTPVISEVTEAVPPAEIIWTEKGEIICTQLDWSHVKRCFKHIANCQSQFAIQREWACSRAVSCTRHAHRTQ